MKKSWKYEPEFTGISIIALFFFLACGIREQWIYSACAIGVIFLDVASCALSQFLKSRHES